MGPFLDPATGVWSTTIHTELPSFEIVRYVKGLDSSVRVFYDRRGVPHIFAHTTLDAYRALGFVVCARDRLFQLEVQDAGGQCCTLTGSSVPAALPLDREDARTSPEGGGAGVRRDGHDREIPYRAARAYADGISICGSGTWDRRICIPPRSTSCSGDGRRGGRRSTRCICSIA